MLLCDRGKDGRDIGERSNAVRWTATPGHDGESYGFHCAWK